MTKFTTKDFYDVLFDKDDYTCFSDSTNARTKSVHARRNGTKESTQYFCINPIVQGQNRITANVTAFRNILIEIDKDENGKDIDRDEQKKMFNRIGLPYATLVWSGGKSLHAIVSLEDPFEDVAEYRNAVIAIYKVLKSGNVPNDSQVKDPVRYSRSAGSVRMNTREFQEIDTIRTRISQKDLIEWLASHDVEIEEPKYHDSNVMYVGTSDASVELKRDWIMKYKMKNMNYVQGEKNHYQFTYARLLRATGLNINDVYSIFRTQFDKIDERKPIESAFSSKYDSDPTIYVPSMEERRKYYKEIEDQERLEVVSDDTINFLIDRDQRVQGETLNEYVLIDNDFFWVDPSDNERRKRTDRAIRARFPGVRLHEIVPEDRVYKGFKYDPNYLEYTRNIGGYYNTFENFEFEPTPGEWPTIKQHLQHLFGKESDDPSDYENQYSEIIEWFRVALIDPKHPLWAIVLTSRHHGVGKNIFAIILKKIFGKNFSAIRRVDIEESKFNTAFAETQVCFIDEFEKVKDPKRAYGMFKEMITATEGIRVEKKGIDSYEVPFYGKFLFAHNDSHVGFPGLEADDRRIWIRNINKPTFVMDDAYVNKIKDEIKHFVYDILYVVKPLYTESHGALWIPKEHTWTIWLDNAKETNRSEIYHKLKSEFDHYFQDHDEEVIYTTARSLATRLNIDRERSITSCLRDEWGAYQDEKTTRRTDYITGLQPKNGTNWFHITREMVYGDESLKAENSFEEYDFFSA